MSLRTIPLSQGRTASVLSFEEITKRTPTRKLISLLPKKSGRSWGKIAVRHQGGRQKRYYRHIDFKRDKAMAGTVASIEYDPNRTVNIALVHYPDGEKRYILAPQGLSIGDTIESGPTAEVRTGHALPLHRIPIGTPIHNIELAPHKGGQLVRSAGTAGSVLSKEGAFVHVKVPSGEVRRIPKDCVATIGQLGNIDWKHVFWGKAGRMRRRGIRPHVRGVAMSPRDHPHGGGEGRSGIGMPSPKSPWGKPTLGKKTRPKKKYSDRFIVARRKS